MLYKEVHTRLVRFGVVLQFGHEIIEFLLSLISSLETPLLELRIVFLEELFICWSQVVGQRWTSNRYNSTSFVAISG